LGIFNQFFTRLLYVSVQARLQIFIYSIRSNFDEVMPYQASHHRIFYISLEVNL